VTFEVDPETLALLICFEDEGLELAAIYHSHPAGPETPSATDIAQAFYPDSVYIICSLAQTGNAVLRGFRIRDGQAIEVNLESALW
jgi:proteasome lid subunit RPN8/RPN11